MHYCDFIKSFYYKFLWYSEASILFHLGSWQFEIRDWCIGFKLQQNGDREYQIKAPMKFLINYYGMLFDVNVD